MHTLIKSEVCKMKESSFEGWYFKQQTKQDALAVIMGKNCKEDGEEEAFIQLLTKEESFFFKYPIKDYFVEKDYFYVRIGKNYVTEENLYLDVEQEGMKIKGFLRFGRFAKLKKPIMGPFSKLPGMECQHEIISMRHAVQGTVRINGRKILFERGVGYAESDAGLSFPESYRWTQCHEPEENFFLFSAVASIPYRGIHFTGTINVIGYQGKLYRMATYLGARVISQTKKQVVIKQGKYTLSIHILDSTASKCGFDLKAPVRGSMDRNVTEQLWGEAEYVFSIKDKEIFRMVSRQASYEISDEDVSKVKK